MKYFFSLLIILIAPLTLCAEEANQTKEANEPAKVDSMAGFKKIMPDYFKTKWYFLGGSSFFAENDDRGVGEGTGVSFGGGIQFNRSIGLELVINQVPEYQTRNVFDNVRRLPGKHVIQADNHTYSSLMWTASIPIDRNVRFVGKLGLSAYRYDSFVEFEEADEDNGLVLGYKQKENGLTLAGSVGVEFPFIGNDDLSVEVTVGRLFGDDSAGAALNAGLKYTF